MDLSISTEVLEELPQSDPVGLKGNSRIERLPKSTGKAFSNSVNLNTEYHDYSVKAESIHAKALFDYWTFIDLIELQGGTKGFDPEFHTDMVDFVTQTQCVDTNIRRRMGLVPRGHAKTTVGSVGYALWRIYRNPNIRIIIATATRQLATTIVREIKQYLESQDLQEKVWNNRPHIPGALIPILDKAGMSRRHQQWKLGETEAQDKKVVWRADAIQVNRSIIMREPTVLVASPKSNITGFHADLVIMDDIINDDTVATEDKRLKTLEWTRDLESIVDPERSVVMGKLGNRELKELIGQEFVVWGTRYHLEDYYAHLLENKKLMGYVLMYRNIYKNFKSNKDGYIWASRFNDTVIERIKVSQGAKRFSSQYLNIIRANEDVIFDRYKIRYMSVSDIQYENLTGNRARITVEEQAVDINLKIVIDPAISEKKTADYTAIAVGGCDFRRNLYVIDYVYGRWLPNEIIAQTYALMDKYSLVAAHVETVAYQRALICMFKENFGRYRPISLLPYLPNGDKESRVKMFLQPLLENSMLFLPNKARGDKEVQNEFEYFPTVHDDILDSFAMLAELSNPVPKSKTQKHWYGEVQLTQPGEFVANPRYGGRLR